MWLATLFNKIVAEGRTPDVWQTSVTVPVWKGKGDIADCTSYRPIRLLCHTMKVFERVLEARLRKIVSVSLNQCGFVKDCSTIDAIHAARILLEKHREKNRSVHLAFLDLEKAFDRVPHEPLWMSMRSHRVPEEYVRWTKLLYAKPTSVVRCAAGKQAIPCTSKGSSGFIPLTSAVHTVHGHDNEGNPEAASVDSTLCRRCHARG
ncbi:hypothetical protein RB195_020395 [Necator americanus]